MDSLIYQAPAKVNLFLEVREKRADGYHEIRSVAVPVSVFDHVALEKADDGLQVAMDPNGAIGADLLPADDGGNLAAMAAMLLKKETGYAGGARIRVQKHIPVGGGLGGGSADAAAVLIGLNRLWDTGLARASLMALGARLGSDVPALIHGGWVVMRGRGERIAPLTAEPPPNGWWLVLVNPGFHVSTGDIYQRYTALTLSPVPFKDTLSFFKEGTVDGLAQGLFNSLQDVVFKKYPLIAMVADALARAGAAGVLLCGSGATVMGLARDKEHAREIEQRTRDSFDFSVWSQVAPLLPDGVMVAHGPLEARV